MAGPLSLSLVGIYYAPRRCKKVHMAGHNMQIQIALMSSDCPVLLSEPHAGAGAKRCRSHSLKILYSAQGTRTTRVMRIRTYCGEIDTVYWSLEYLARGIAWMESSVMVEGIDESAK